MKALLFFCEAATSHPDGTMSILKAWIDQVGAKELPIRVRGTLIGRVELGPEEIGKHSFQIRGIAPSGELFADMTGEFEADGRPVMVVTPVQVGLGEVGQSRFALRVDGVDVASWVLTAVVQERTEVPS